MPHTTMIDAMRSVVVCASLLLTGCDRFVAVTGKVKLPPGVNRTGCRVEVRKMRVMFPKSRWGDLLEDGRFEVPLNYFGDRLEVTILVACGGKTLISETREGPITDKCTLDVGVIDATRQTPRPAEAAHAPAQ